MTGAESNLDDGRHIRSVVGMYGLRKGLSCSFSDHPILFLASTENADAIDGALLRSGRFEHIVTLPAPDVLQRALLFRAVLGTISHVSRLELGANTQLVCGGCHRRIVFIPKHRAFQSGSSNC